MRNSLILLLSLLIISGCSKTKQKNIAEHKTDLVQVKQYEDVNLNENHKKSAKDDFLNNENAKHSPVKIVSSHLSRNQYSTHKDIKLTFKNITKKDIQAIKFEWYCENSFNEPANGRYFYGEGRSTGEIAYLLKAGKIQSKVWEDFSTDANRIIKARACHVAFTDGTKWELK